MVLVALVCVPLEIGFSEFRLQPTATAADWITTAAFIADIGVQLRTGFITQGEVERRGGMVALHYLRTSFMWDLPPALPYRLIVSTSSRHSAWLGLLKLPRLRRLSRALSAGHNSRFANVLGMARLLVTLLIIVHSAVCLWHNLYENMPGWPWSFSKCAGCGFSTEYLLGFYNSMLLILGDKQEAHNNVERCLFIVLLFLGALFYAVMVSSMTLLVTNMWATASRHKQRATMVDDALRYSGVSEEVREKVGAYHTHMAAFDHPGSDGVAFLQELPLFAFCERPFLWRLAQRLQMSLFMAGDTIYSLGSVGHEMYVIWTGAVALVGADGGMAALLTGGDHFGELGLMTAATPRPHRAVRDLVALNHATSMSVNIHYLSVMMAFDATHPAKSMRMGGCGARAQ
ncbi:Cyclic nucleotide-gated cation channel alpha-4 [Tetrabaena socialis]|uniref:Cyclic nucleotide-gated cation channel alpha-4 n=1 Tax=Tetrabaena socialis TaxID=47790 RepID=A0A2J7ZWW1_9CHLO|nr:Cyclic nucleotide-gated cation channel alpha-4 [Tetrabaena socialis]|eukprot:PNH04754.1 Cyclic nucleotide-gated cation channel alpha-4 [Tetrabaena socialis]